MTAKRTWQNPGTGRWDEDLTVTPEIAEHWLTQCQYADQRKITQAKVDSYALARLAGLWNEDNESPIKIDVGGEVIDGNHRLWMVLETSLPTKFHIHYNVPSEVFNTTDIGLPRRLADVGLPEYRGNKRAAAISNAMAKGVPSGTSMRLAACLPLMREFQERHAEAITFTANLARSSRRGITAPVLGAIARAYYHVPHHELMLFADRLQTGRIDNDSEGSVLVLRDWLMGPHTKVKGRSVAAETYLKTARAIELFVSRTPVGRLYAAAEDPFPLPS